MIKTITILPGVTLRCHTDHRFKQGALSLQLVRPMDETEAAMNALLPAVWLRGAENYPDLRAITLKLDDLYGASVSALVRRIGDYQTTGLYCSFMEDRFAMDADEILAPMIGFLKELLRHPIVENGGLCGDFVESEKKNLISTIESERNDKRVYTSAQLLRTMCKADSFGIPRLGTTEQAKKIDAVSLYAHHRKILCQSPIELFYVGSAAPERVAELLTELFAGLDREQTQYPAQTPFRDAGGEKKVETLNVAQSQLCLGFVTDITNRDSRFAAMQVLNTLFGAGMTSKLFVNIREKQSLCYDIGSSYYGSKGILTVNAGIDFDKEGLVRAEIEKELAGCREGRITPEELAAAKASICSSLTGTHDSPGAIEGYYASGALSGNRLDPEAYIAAVQAVTADDCARVASTLRYHTGFFLKGGA